MPSELTTQLAKHIREIYFGVNWTWSNIRDNLSDVTWQEATQKIGELNTILGLTYHIHYYVASLESVLSGGPLLGKDKYSFDHPAIHSQIEWEQFLEKMYGEAEALAETVEQMDEKLIWTVFSAEKYGNYFRNIAGFIEHSHYHLGQIVVIKKMIRATM
ncbi:MAG: DUF1572 domain-containing protein [Saprospiraceae bacterium]|nr:DUF1572 domain-containing protein [Saprospiraceae bacterium]